MPQAQPSDVISTRERVYEVAAELFAERGYTGTSMADIASRVGIRKPSVYNYCSSKEELFLELLGEAIDSWGRAADPGLESDGTHEERLYRHLLDTVEFAVASPHAVAMCRLAVSQVTGELGERARGILLAHRLDYQQRLEAFFAEASEAGEVLPISSQALTLSWFTFLDGFLTHQVFSIGDREAVYREHLDELWRLFWRGLAPSRRDRA